MRLINLPHQDKLRNLSFREINQIVRRIFLTNLVIGLVTQRKPIYYRLIKRSFRCNLCKYVLGPILMEKD